MAWCSRSCAGLLVLGGAFTLAAGCGSDDPKQASRADAGAAGAAEPAPAGGGNGGAVDEVAGAPGVPSAGHGGSATAGGNGGDANEINDAGGAGGGSPIASCERAGSVSGLDLDAAPIHQGCRGALLAVPFEADDASATFACCGVSTSRPRFGVSLEGAYNFEGGGLLELQVPEDAPFGSYQLDIDCPTTAGRQAITVQINDAAAPMVLSVSAEITPSGPMVIAGKNLTPVHVGAVRASDGSYFGCEPRQESATRITCDFGGAIPVSTDSNDVYYIDVVSDECGYAASPPAFTVVSEPT